MRNTIQTKLENLGTEIVEFLKTNFPEESVSEHTYFKIIEHTNCFCFDVYSFIDNMVAKRAMYRDYKNGNHAFYAGSKTEKLGDIDTLKEFLKAKMKEAKSIIKENGSKVSRELYSPAYQSRASYCNDGIKVNFYVSWEK